MVESKVFKVAINLFYRRRSIRNLFTLLKWVKSPGTLCFIGVDRHCSWCARSHCIHSIHWFHEKCVQWAYNVHVLSFFKVSLRSAHGAQLLDSGNGLFGFGIVCIRIFPLRQNVLIHISRLSVVHDPLHVATPTPPFSMSGISHRIISVIANSIIA